MHTSLSSYSCIYKSARLSASAKIIDIHIAYISSESQQQRQAMFLSDSSDLLGAAWLRAS